MKKNSNNKMRSEVKNVAFHFKIADKITSICDDFSAQFQHGRGHYTAEKIQMAALPSLAILPFLSTFNSTKYYTENIAEYKKFLLPGYTAYTNTG